MITVVSDTHGRDGHRLTGRTLDAVREADHVLHAGDFNTEAVLDAFREEAASFHGVHGNNDTPGVRERLPRRRTVDFGDLRIAMVHGHEHTDTSLALYGRQENADLVVVGHSHRPDFRSVADVPVLNPGSHAEPRRYHRAHAELEHDPLRGRLVQPDGTELSRFEV
ncbi:metallophosphoesterase [Halomarina oriensis]|uniref:Phosphoesterase n=1 Tax=Halomarina oriensis TaxID=671145 RepID=A0A6B0GNT0_9EURY|nr:metallophosphoesterase [Halomarina oriensis]MWG34343.1 YfcE family phosphodiesterase [Halomarina oriensis]